MCDRYEYVQIDGLQCSLVAIDYGALQGFIFRSLLFLIYINDITLKIPVYFRLFVDDCIAFSEIKIVWDQNSLNNFLAIVREVADGV